MPDELFAGENKFTTIRADNRKLTPEKQCKGTILLQNVQHMFITAYLNEGCI
jgi:hypothetical protein